VKNRAFLGIAVMVVVFLLGFLPQFVKAKRLENELRVERQQNTLAQLRDLVGLAYLQTTQKNYGLAAGTSTRFFSRVEELVNQTADDRFRKSLQDLLSFRDRITAALAKADPAVVGDLQNLFLKTREVTTVSRSP
jgi:hypothetical protein